MDKDIKSLWWLFILEGILSLIAFFQGGLDFVVSNKKDIILLSLGFLTFISIFFGFISYDKGKTFKEEFKKKIDDDRTELFRQLTISVKNKEANKIDKLNTKLIELDSFSGNINPEKWLLLSIFFFLGSILFSFFDIQQNIPSTPYPIVTITAILFHFGILFTTFLINSLFVWIINANKKYKELISNK